MAIDIESFPIENGDFPSENSDFPIENSDFPIEHSDFPIENGDVPIENCDFPRFSIVFPLNILIFHSYVKLPDSTGMIVKVSETPAEISGSFPSLVRKKYHPVILHIYGSG